MIFLWNLPHNLWNVAFQYFLYNLQSSSRMTSWKVLFFIEKLLGLIRVTRHKMSPREDFIKYSRHLFMSHVNFLFEINLLVIHTRKLFNLYICFIWVLRLTPWKLPIYVYFGNENSVYNFTHLLIRSLIWKLAIPLWRHNIQRLDTCMFI